MLVDAIGVLSGSTSTLRTAPTGPTGPTVPTVPSPTFRRGPDLTPQVPTEGGVRTEGQGWVGGDGGAGVRKGGAQESVKGEERRIGGC